MKKFRVDFFSDVYGSLIAREYLMGYSAEELRESLKYTNKHNTEFIEILPVA